MKKEVVVFGNRYQGAHAEDLNDFFSELLAREDISIAIDRDYRDYLAGIISCLPGTARTIDGFDFDADLALSIGGDGTFLHTANRVGDKQIPIMGINSGHLGYLSAAPLSDFHKIINDIAEDNYVIEKRSMLSVSCDTYPLLPRSFALNEAAILRQDTGSMISVDTFIDGFHLATYLGDGLIISTPTGSTAYNLSVGGPILAPKSSNWVISPIAPHSLNMRPLVVGDDTTIELLPHSRSNTFTLSLDGIAQSLTAGTKLKLSKAPFATFVVLRHHNTFADTLRSKLLWGVNSQ
ncbi:MAG: NAD kinase [Paramuribaculum sp.]|nr:NAD kinase [Paramuribaculum sp.]